MLIGFNNKIRGYQGIFLILLLNSELFYSPLVHATGLGTNCINWLQNSYDNTTELPILFLSVENGLPKLNRISLNSDKYLEKRKNNIGKDYVELIFSGDDLETRLSALDLLIEKELKEPFFLFTNEKTILRRHKRILNASAKLLNSAKANASFVDKLTDLILLANPERRGILNYKFKWSNYIRSRLKARFFASLFSKSINVSSTKGALLSHVKGISATLALNAFFLKINGNLVTGLPSIESLRLKEIKETTIQKIKALIEEEGFSENVKNTLLQESKGRLRFDYAWGIAVAISTLAVITYFTYTSLYPDMSEEDKKKLTDQQVDEFYNNAADESKKKLDHLQLLLKEPGLSSEKRDSIQHDIEVLKSLLE